MPTVTFRCPSCGTSFSLPSERLPASGARGRCQRCGAALVVFPDGNLARAEEDTDSGPKSSAPPTQAAGAEAQPTAEPIWEVKKPDPNQDFDRGPFTIGQIREKILDGQLMENDLARVHDGEWAPVCSYPALGAHFSEALQLHRQQHGDEGHCAIHRETRPRWECEKCQNYLCQECVRNEPLIEGGAPHYLCRSCGGETRTIGKRKGGLKGLVGGIWGR